MNLSFPKEGYEIRVFTDASKRACYGVVTQTLLEGREIVSHQQKHDLLAFIGSDFKNSELRWTRFENEGFALDSTFKRLDYL